MKYKNITLIGTSHIAKQSIEDVKSAIQADKPDVIALELDKKRLYALLNSNKSRPRITNIKQIGIKGYIFSLIGEWAERKLGESVGVKPGSEMLIAIKEAEKTNIRIALIDQDIELTLKRFSKSLTWREKWFFIADILKAVVTRKKEIEFDLTKVPSEKLIKKIIDKVRERYPNVYRVLVTERNNVMAENLLILMKKNQESKILGVVGAGHEKEIVNLIKRYEKRQAVIKRKLKYV